MDQSQVVTEETHSKVGMGEKKVYEKPAIVFERPLEALAAVCEPISGGKAPGTCGSTFS